MGNNKEVTLTIKWRSENVQYYIYLSIYNDIYLIRPFSRSSSWLAPASEKNGKENGQHHFNGQLSRKYYGVTARSSAYGRSKCPGK